MVFQNLILHKWGYTEPKELYNTIGAAYKKYPLALLMHEADLEATYFYNM